MIHLQIASNTSNNNVCRLLGVDMLPFIK